MGIAIQRNPVQRIVVVVVLLLLLLILLILLILLLIILLLILLLLTTPKRVAGRRISRMGCVQGGKAWHAFNLPHRSAGFAVV
jgi:uncharacterized protein (DUF58 family)